MKCKKKAQMESKSSEQETLIYIYIYIQGVPGGMYQTSGECSLC